MVRCTNLYIGISRNSAGNYLEPQTLNPVVCVTCKLLAAVSGQGAALRVLPAEPDEFASRTFQPASRATPHPKDFKEFRGFRGFIGLVGFIECIGFIDFIGLPEP